MQLAKRAHGEIDGIVARILASCKDALQLFQHPNDCEHLAFDIDLFAFRQLIWKKLLRSIGTKHDYGCAALLVELAEPAAGGGCKIIDARERCGNSFKSCVLCFAAAVLHDISAGTKYRLAMNYLPGH